MITAASSTSRRKTAVTVVGAIGAVGAAAAVAGLGTFGGFTDSTVPVRTDVDTGVVSIEISEAGDSGTVPFAGGSMVAGDSRSHVVDLVNTGDTALGSVAFDSWATRSSVLDSDPVHGLQLSVESCSVSWVEADSGYTCAGDEGRLYDGPIVVADHVLAGSATASPGGVDHLLLTATLPVSATGDVFGNAVTDLNFMFTGTQRTGSAR